MTRPARAPWRRTQCHRGPLARPEWVYHEMLTPVHSMTPPTTLVNNGPTTAPTSTLRNGHLPGDSKQRWAEMTASLSAELDGRVPPGLVAEIVQAVLDESRQAVQARAAEMTMLEARLRLERFIRARVSR